MDRTEHRGNGFGRLNSSVCRQATAEQNRVKSYWYWFAFTHHSIAFLSRHNKSTASRQDDEALLSDKDCLTESPSMIPLYIPRPPSLLCTGFGDYGEEKTAKRRPRDLDRRKEEGTEGIEGIHSLLWIRGQSKILDSIKSHVLMDGIEGQGVNLSCICALQQ